MAALLNTSMLANVFHSFPHVDFNFYNATLLFTPDDLRYQQALFFNGIYVIFAATVLFLLFSIYFLVCSCYFCANCRSQALKPRPTRSRCLRLLIGALAVLSCFPLGILFYGNNKAQDGVEKFASGAKKIYNIFDLYKFKNKVLARYVTLGLQNGVEKLESTLPFNISLPEVRLLLYNLSSVQEILQQKGNLLKDVNVDLKSVSEDCLTYDSLRWWITLCILLWQLILILITIYSAFSRRRCPFIVLTIMAVISLFLMMASVSVEVPLSIGAGDLCTYPKQSLLQYITKPAANDLVRYYLECSNSTNPLQQSYKVISEELLTAQALLDIVKLDPLIHSLPSSQIYIDIIQQSLTNSENVLDQLMEILGCAELHKEFESSLAAVCNTLLDGLGLLMLCSILTSLLIIITLLCITPIWKALAPLRPILKRDKVGVHLVTDSYQGPPGGSESFHGSSSFDVSYKSIDDNEFEHLPLLAKRDRGPPSYRAIHGSTEFLSVEEEDRRGRRGINM
ncbi:protein tweety homolog 2-like isoform X1 [Hydractinia symbiolongicarpus]|uniref:protein tweety homolog 2-like isoform X1 n=1 Tax=Hydractinia symbiolongicarpus TaxID=13093 RepID=UPI00254B8D06|nr:protein tweety homolog 2-like isoform X1 [Hydractinia symbiolongicarpus]